MIILVIRLLGAWAMPRKVFLYTLLVKGCKTSEMTKVSFGLASNDQLVLIP